MFQGVISLRSAPRLLLGVHLHLLPRCGTVRGRRDGRRYGGYRAQRVYLPCPELIVAAGRSKIAGGR